MHDIIDQYCEFDRTDEDGRRYQTRTRFVRVEKGVQASAGRLLAPYLGSGRVALFQDVNTQKVAGDEVVRSLRDAGVEVDAFVVDPAHRDHDVVCDDAQIAAARALLTATPYSHAIAVGAGTINDIVKMASFQAEIDYSVVGTAPSMNGYTSAIAAILSDGVKTTQPCNAPIAALADPDTMAAAPYRMIASGLGDLYSKPVSNADWRLSHRLLGTFHSDIVMEIVDAAGEILLGVAPKLPARDVEAVAQLTGAIMLSGLAMQAAGTSGPASGGEHLVSHYIDMTAIAFGQPHDFHGCQVAVGTCATISLYEEVRNLDPSTIDIEACVQAHPEWEQHEPTIRERFGVLADAVLPHAVKMYPTRDEVRARLHKLVAEWDGLMEDVGTTLRAPDDLRDELRSAQCPTWFGEINVVPDRAHAALAWSKDIRARYTILHLASELGLLDDFVARYVARSVDNA